MADDAEPPPDAWAIVATVPSPRLAAELAGLCRDARIPARVLPAGAPFAADERAPVLHIPGDDRLAVWVPERELPVAIGVADRLLHWFRADAEGEATPEEIAAGLLTDDPELRAAAARERERAARHGVWLRRLALAVLALAAAAIAAGAALAAGPR